MMRYRYAIAVTSGVAAYLLILYRSLPYWQRNRLSINVCVLFAEVALVIGFIVTLGVTRGRYRIAAFVLLAVCLAHLGVMIADYRQDPSTHNLAPFEFLVLCFFAAPAFVGAFIAQIVDYVRTRGRT